MGRGKKGVWKGKVDMEKVGMGGKRWHEEERSHAGRRAWGEKEGIGEKVGMEGKLSIGGEGLQWIQV